MKLCIDCPNRTINCHSYCRYYIEFRQEKLKEYDEKVRGREYSDYTSERFWREGK